MSGAFGSSQWMYASGAAAAAGFYDDYTLDQSLRFDRASSQYLTRTPSSDGNRKTFTLSFWYKNCDNANGQTFFRFENW